MPLPPASPPASLPLLRSSSASSSSSQHMPKSSSTDSLSRFSATSACPVIVAMMPNSADGFYAYVHSDPVLKSHLIDVSNELYVPRGDEMARFKQRYGAFTRMLTLGCGAARCETPLCRSSSEKVAMKASTAAGLALQCTLSPVTPLCPRIAASMLASHHTSIPRELFISNTSANIPPDLGEYHSSSQSESSSQKACHEHRRSRKASSHSHARIGAASTAFWKLASSSYHKLFLDPVGLPHVANATKNSVPADISPIATESPSEMLAPVPMVDAQAPSMHRRRVTFSRLPGLPLAAAPSSNFPPESSFAIPTQVVPIASAAASSTAALLCKPIGPNPAVAVASRPVHQSYSRTQPSSMDTIPLDSVSPVSNSPVCLGILTLPLIERVVGLLEKSTAQSASPALSAHILGLQSANARDAAARFLQDSLRVVFSDPKRLALSFLLDDTGDSPNRTSDARHPSGVDINSIREAFMILDAYNTANCDAVAIMLKAADNMLEKLLEQNAFAAPLDNIETLEHMRALWIITELYALSSGRMELRLCQFERLLASLGGPVRGLLVAWIAAHDQIGFSSLVKILRQHIDQVFQREPVAPTSQVSYAVRALDIVWDAWQQSNEKIDRSEFVSSAVCERQGLWHMFAFWRMRRMRRMRRQSSTAITSFHYLDYPFLFDLDRRVLLFRIATVAQMSVSSSEATAANQIAGGMRRGGCTFPMLPSEIAAVTAACDSHLTLNIRRHQIVEDFLFELRSKRHALHRPLRVRFIGSGEEGLDQGGPQKEFFIEAAPLLFHLNLGMFIYDEDTRLRWFNPHSVASNEHFEALGTFLGLALHSGAVLDLNFPILLWKLLLQLPATLEDICEIDPEVGQGLTCLLMWEGDDVEEVFCRSFEVTERVAIEHASGEWRPETVRTIELVPGGSDIAVTNANRHSFVHEYVRYLSEGRPGSRLSSFRRGFLRVCDESVLKLFTPEELSQLASGSTILDFAQLEAVTEYEEGFSAKHPTIKFFWSVVHGMTHEERLALLRFVTACDRAPSGGLGQLKFYILRNGSDSERLPTSYTCFNRLLLPEYESESTLRERLLIAIEHGVGFGLV